VEAEAVCRRHKRAGGNPKLDLKYTRAAVVSKGLKLALLECCDAWNVQALLQYVVAIPNVLVADKAEKEIRDAAIGCRKLDLM
jgi:hypothetical protein